MSPGWTASAWCRRRDSNPRPPHYECGALPAELQRRRARLRAKRVGLRNLWIDRLAFRNSYQVTASIMTQAVQLDEADTSHICERELAAMGRVALLHSQAKD